MLKGLKGLKVQMCILQSGAEHNERVDDKNGLICLVVLISADDRKKLVRIWASYLKVRLKDLI